MLQSVVHVVSYEHYNIMKFSFIYSFLLPSLQGGVGGRLLSFSLPFREGSGVGFFPSPFPSGRGRGRLMNYAAKVQLFFYMHKSFYKKSFFFLCFIRNCLIIKTSPISTIKSILTVFDLQYSTLDFQHSTFNIRLSTLDFQHSTFNSRLSTLNTLPLLSD